MMNHELVGGCAARRWRRNPGRAHPPVGGHRPLAAQFVASGRMKVDGLIRAQASSADSPPARPRTRGDLLSYLLFDGDFAADLIELGRTNAAKKEDEARRAIRRVGARRASTVNTSSAS